MNKYAISDIHGCLKTFKSLLKKIAFSQKDKLFILGDLIDRGPDSKGVIDFIWKLQHKRYNIQCIRGNHDQMMLHALHSMKGQRNWLLNGGWTVIENFNAENLSDIPLEYFNFIKEMPYFLEVDNYILVHAGFNFASPNPLDDYEAMLWQRNWYDTIDYKWLNNRTIVHGHTPITLDEINTLANKIEEQQYLNIDTGCVHQDKGAGVLTCFDMNKQELIFQENLELV